MISRSERRDSGSNAKHGHMRARALCPKSRFEAGQLHALFASLLEEGYRFEKPQHHSLGLYLARLRNLVVSRPRDGANYLRGSGVEVWVEIRTILDHG